MTDPAVVEGVRAAIAAYTHALDDGRTDDVVATYIPEGTFEMPGVGNFTGRAELREAYLKWVPKVPQRHLVANTVVTTDDGMIAEAVSDVVLIVKGDDGWSTDFVARYHDVLTQDGPTWRFVRRSVQPAR